MHINPDNYTPFAPNGWRGIHQGAAIVFFAYIGFDAISTAAEETRNPQRNMPIGILGGLAICTVIYIVVGIVATGIVPYTQLRAADPLAQALQLAGLPTVGAIVAFGAVVSMTAVLLVFQYGQPRIFFAMARDGLLPAVGGQNPSEVPHSARHDARDRHRRWRSARSSSTRTRSTISQTSEPYRRSRSCASACSCSRTPIPAGRVRSAFRPYRVVATGGAAACLYVMFGLPPQAWERFGIWLAIGLVLYFAYGYRHSRLHQRG